jgi:hypothetical protein
MDELEQSLRALRDRVAETGMQGGIREPAAVLATTLLGLSVIRLDKTSTELSRANMHLTRTYTWLTLTILLVAIVQFVLMVRGR